MNKNFEGVITGIEYVQRRKVVKIIMETREITQEDFQEISKSITAPHVSIGIEVEATRRPSRTDGFHQ